MADADPLAVAVRFTLYAVLGVAFGFPLFWLYGVGPDGRSVFPLRRIVGASAAIGGAVSVLGLAVLAAGMAGVAPTEVDRASVLTVAAMPGIGTAWTVRVAALAGLAVASLALRAGRPLAVIASALGAVALASLAWNGHATMTEGMLHFVHLGADMLHLLAGGAWLGALVALVMLLGRAEAAAIHRAVAGFAGAGSVIVGTLVVTGLINTWAIFGVDGIGGAYLVLFVLKLLLFALMLGLAARHRYRLVPALAGGLHSIAALRRSVCIEAALAFAILAVVAWLGVLAPTGAS